jgi:glycosyltransferase involved in cell wall biosynthesis
VVNHKKNKGYGAALKSGFKAAKYDWVFFTDGDLQFKLEQIKRLVTHTSTNDIIIGYRQKRAEGAFRAFNARLFKLYIDLLFRLNVRDIDCAFKLMKTDVIKSIHLESGGAFTSAEFLYKLKKQGYAFKQVGVTHLKRRFGKPTGSNLQVIIRAGFEALRLYLTIKSKSLQAFVSDLGFKLKLAK